MNRLRKLPGSYSDAELAQIEADARQAGKLPVVYVRERLQLPQVSIGRPPAKFGKNGTSKRNQNNS